MFYHLQIVLYSLTFQTVIHGILGRDLKMSQIEQLELFMMFQGSALSTI